MTDPTSAEDDAVGHLAENALVAFIADRAREAWELKSQPYFLSNLAPALKKAGYTYKDVTGNDGLAAWAEGVEQDQWRFVRHPEQKSKIGVVPAGHLFEFDTREEPRPADEPGRSRRKAVVIRFLEELRRLDQSDLDKVVLPVSVIVKLLDE